MSKKVKKIVFIAGEPSGDAIGANIILQMRKANKDLIFSGVGGKKMLATGYFRTIFDIKDISVMGFVEVLSSLLRILSRIKMIIRYIDNVKPDLLIMIDSPALSIRVVKKIRKYNKKLKIIQLVAPTVWAYKEHRAKEFAKYYSAILCIFPFEPSYFKKYGMKAKFIGNPIMDNIKTTKITRGNIFSNFNKDCKVITITLGSRVSEVEVHLDIMIKYITHMIQIFDHNIRFCIPTLNHLMPLIEDKIPKDLKHYIKIIDSNNAIDICSKISDFVLAKSGTNALEFVLRKIPIIIYYKVHTITAILVKMMVNRNILNPINILAKKEIIPELYQEKVNLKNLLLISLKYLNDQQFANKQVKECQKELKKLIENNRSSGENASDFLIKILNERD